MRVLSLVMAISFSLLATTGFSSNNLPENETVTIYTTYGDAGMRIFTPIDLYLVINNEIVIAQSIPDPTNINASIIKLDKKYLNKEISQSLFNWIIQGTRYKCNANNLPVFIQEGDINTATKINFKCEKG